MGALDCIVVAPEVMSLVMRYVGGTDDAHTMYVCTREEAGRSIEGDGQIGKRAKYLFLVRIA